MSETKRTEISSLGEFKLIDHLTANFAATNSSTIKGVGDDAAVISCGSLTPNPSPEERGGRMVKVVTTDMLVEGIHFDLMYFPLRSLGYKSVAVNLSDVYAMNATPKQITVSIAISNRFSVEALEEFYEGIQMACKKFEVDLVGGDTTSSNKGFIISVTAIGEANENEIVYRSGAKAGDLLCVSGDLGAAYCGLQLLEREKAVFREHPEAQPEFSNRQYIIGRCLKPEPRKDVIDFFRHAGIKPTSMIDISDGLSSEIFHLCKQSETGCMLQEENVPIDQETYHQALEFNVDPITCALSGGEDYELLFTIDPKDEKKIRDADDLRVIGKILEKEKGMKMITKGGNEIALTALGWDAFKPT